MDLEKDCQLGARNIAPKCQHFGLCGGCKAQDITYEKQLTNKEAVVRKLFPDSLILSISSSPQIYQYRNRMDFAFGPDYSLGLKASKFEIVNIEKCWLMSDQTVEILDRLRSFMRAKELKGYIYGAADKTRGPMRHVVIREGINIKNTVLNILTADKFVFPLEELWQEMRDLVQGITWSVNLSPADRSFGEIQKTCGQDHYWESLGGLKFKVPVQAFFQTNTLGAEKLIKIVQEFVGPKGHETLLDLYSGTGSIGLSLAKQFKRVVGIEENEAAVELSKENAKLNGIANYSAQAGKVEKLLNPHNIPDPLNTLTILDPPRPGLHKKVVEKLGAMRPRQIIYVSCNPTTQKRDVDLFKEFGYKIEKIQPLDMFPHTPHVENVIKLGLI